MHKKAAFMFAFLTFLIPVAAAQSFDNIFDIKTAVIVISIVGIVSAMYIIFSPAMLPSGNVTIGPSFKVLLIVGALIISGAEVVLAMEALGIIAPLGLPIVHDSMMAVSLVFVALALRQMGLIKKNQESETSYLKTE